jgi:hypothetical protein
MDKELIIEARAICDDIKLYIRLNTTSKNEARDAIHDRFINKFCPSRNEQIIEMVREMDLEFNKHFS